MSPRDPARPPLAAVERLFWELIAAPEGVEKALAARDARGDDARDRIRSWIASDARLSAEGRLDVYANMYFYRIKDAIAEDFAKTARVLGEARWHNLMTDYLLAHPSTHPSIRWVGAKLPAYLRSHPEGTARPGLADLAEIEWAFTDVFQERNATPLVPADLADVAPSDWPALTFRPVPALRLLRLERDVEPLWRRLEEDDALGAEALAEEPPPAPGFVLVHRARFTPDVRSLPAVEGTALEALLGGATFGDVCGLLAGDREDADVAAAAARAASLLASWVVAGLFARPAAARRAPRPRPATPAQSPRPRRDRRRHSHSESRSRAPRPTAR